MICGPSLCLLVCIESISLVFLEDWFCCVSNWIILQMNFLSVKEHMLQSTGVFDFLLFLLVFLVFLLTICSDI